MTTTFDEYKILIPLDSLLETNMGTAAKINPKAPIEILNNGYYKRDSNNLWEYTNLFSESEFKSAYSKRDINTLAQSVKTNLIEYFCAMIQAKTVDYMDKGSEFNANVIINAFPYKINKVLQAHLCSTIHTLFLQLVNVSIQFIDVFDLSVAFLKKEKINALVLNDFNDWIKIHFNELDNNKYPILEIYAPMISKGIKEKILDGISKGEIYEDIAKEFSPFRLVELILEKHLKVNYLPLEFYSIPIV